MLALLAAVALLLEEGFFHATPYPNAAQELARGFDRAAALDASEADAAPPDDAPSSVRRIPALRSALSAAASTRFADAARALTAFAAAEPHAFEAGWALRRSYRYWVALGHDNEARAVLASYERTQARRESRAAAIFFWERMAELTDDLRRSEHARSYLAEHAAHGPRDLQIVAASVIAAALWRRSCTAARYGLCVSVEIMRRATPRCGSPSVESIVAKTRDRALRRAALDHATAVLRLGASLDLAEVAPWRRGELRAALGQAAGILAADVMERLIALEFPTDLNFLVNEWKRDAGVPRWTAEYRAEVRRRERSGRLFRGYWQRSSVLLGLAHDRTLAVARYQSGSAIIAVSLQHAVALAKVQADRRYRGNDPVEFAGCEVELDRPLLAESQALLAGCAQMIRSGSSLAPDFDACFDGLGIDDQPSLVEYYRPLAEQPAAEPEVGVGEHPRGRSVRR